MIKQRRLSVGERIMFVAEREAINCIFPFRIAGSFNPDQLQAVLNRLQQKHPLLRALIKQIDGYPSFILKEDAPSIPITLYDRLDDEHWLLLVKQSWKDHIDLREGPLAKLIWIRGNLISDFILICPHCIADGASITAILREFLLLLNDINTDIGEPQTLIESALMPYTASLTKRVKIGLKALIGKCAAQLFLPKRLASNKTINLDDTYMVRYRLPSVDMQNLLTCCRQHQVSLYALMSAIFFDEVARIFPKPKGKLICPVDIRKYIPSLKEDQLFAFAPIIDLKVEKETSIWDQAKKLKKQLQIGLAKIDAHEIIYINEHLQSIVPKLLNHLRTNEGSHDFTFSNMGSLAIPSHFDNFKVEQIYSPTVAFPWKNPSTMVISTYHDVLDMTFTSNEAVLREEDAKRFLKQVIQRLRDLIEAERVQSSINTATL
ncbi:condensation domain-containing protein [Olivibacter sp. CPCC 100613]|uniref:condensation domain-containing protein n=1 Tax=Olivibacter sp. CPCC 100613 TaxID=3079931 RepID=UPI002FF502B8